MEKPYPSGLPECSRIVLAGLLDLARTRPEFGKALGELHGWLGKELSRLPTPTGKEPAGSSCSDERLDQALVSIAGERRVVRLPDNTGDLRRQRETRDVDMERVAERAGCKATAYAEATALERKGAGPDACQVVRTALAPFAEDLPSGLVAVLSGECSMPAGRGLDVLAACYGNVSLAAGIVLHLRHGGHLDGAPPTELLYLLAEAQSALLGALAGADVYADSDQHDLFLWLKDQTTRHRIYVDRHMRLDDPADCGASEDLARRLRELDAGMERRKAIVEEEQRLLGKLRYHCGKVCDNGRFEGADWDALSQAATEWCQAGHTPGAAASVLAPLDALMPAGTVLHPDLERLLHDDVGPDEVQGVSEERWRSREDLLARARELLAGRSVTLFARREREPSKVALENEFRLAELNWVELGEDNVAALLEQEIVRPEVNLVLIAMRLSAPLYDIFKGLCIEHSKPFVRLPNGYGPGQVAQQVLRQIGRRLRPVESEST